MGRIVGIDLGTTYSAVAIPEERLEKGFLMVRGCPGASVILDGNKRRITPSVVAEDESGKIVVGYPAKARAGLPPEPIMFSKRWMGEDRAFTLAKQGVLRPEQVAAQVLRYLKEMAEAALKDKVDEAVITVPAYFSLQAKQMTEKAGELAGLKVAQIAQEPVAAALMYCAGDPRENLKILTYDLGGGTFDVAVLEKRDGAISSASIKAFDGDRFLGGYNFDEKLAWWIVEQLKSDYALDLNLEDTADKIRFAKFMVMAERAKIALSGVDHVEIQEPTSGVKDHAGVDVAVQLTLTRETFEDMIRKHIEESIYLCRRALEKAGLRADQLDEILMVGGSSRIPMIGRRLEEEFNKKPRLVEPDLCVALGAGILAGARRGTDLGSLKLDPIPAQTDRPTLTVTGKLVASPKVAQVGGCAVRLRATDGSYEQNRTSTAEGSFFFKDVPLHPEAVTKFALTASAPGAGEVASHRFEVKQTAAAASASLVEVASTNVLSKPIGLQLATGLDVIAPERTPLPLTVRVPCKTADTSGEIRIPIMEEHTPLGEIVMKNIPTSLAVGSVVEVTVTIDENYRVVGRAHVPALKRDEKVEINIPKVKVPTRDELQRRLDELDRRAKDAVASAGRGAAFGDPRVKRIRQLIPECQDMLRAQAPDLSKINDTLNEVESLVKELGRGWKADPPRAVFDQKCSEAEQLITQLAREVPDSRNDGYDKRLAAIKAEADKAETGQNTAAWKDQYQRVCKLCEDVGQRLQSRRSDGAGADTPPDPTVLLINLAQGLRNLAEYAKQQGVYEKHKKEFEDARDSLQKINPKAPEAMAQIRDWYYTKFEELRKRLEAPTPADGPGLVLREKK